MFHYTVSSHPRCLRIYSLPISTCHMQITYVTSSTNFVPSLLWSGYPRINLTTIQKKNPTSLFENLFFISGFFYISKQGQKKCYRLNPPAEFSLQTLMPGFWHRWMRNLEAAKAIAGLLAASPDPVDIWGRWFDRPFISFSQ